MNSQRNRVISDSNVIKVSNLFPNKNEDKSCLFDSLEIPKIEPKSITLDYF